MSLTHGDGLFSVSAWFGEGRVIVSLSPNTQSASLALLFVRFLRLSCTNIKSRYLKKAVYCRITP